jgi:Bacterial Ig-like domain (group 2)
MKRKQIRFIGYCLAVGLIVVLILGMAACSSTPTSTPIPTLSFIAVTPASPASLAVGYPQRFTATGTYSDGSTANITYQVTWTSSDTAVATISSAGLVTGLVPGNTDITAALSGVTSPAVIVVVSTPTSTPIPTLSSIAVTPVSPASLAVGYTQQFTATGTYPDGSTSDITYQVTWASSNASVATISPAGWTTWVAAGTTNITATLGTITSPAVILTVVSP